MEAFPNPAERLSREFRTLFRFLEDWGYEVVVFDASRFFSRIPWLSLLMWQAPCWWRWRTKQITEL